VLAVVAPQVRSVERIDAGHGAPARAIAIIDATGNAPQRLADAFSAGWIEWVVLLAGAAVPGAPEEWALVGEYPGPHPALLRLARLASRPRWRRHLLYSTSEYRSQWLAVFRAGCFGDQPALRVYVFQRVRPAAGPDGESRPTAGPAGADAPRVPGVPGPIRASPFQPAVRIRRHRLAALVTKLRRLVRVEWLLLRGRRRER
jgi:hypothetical protein